MAKTVDMELKKAFAELQAKMIDTSQKMSIADLQIENLKKTLQHSKLTQKEMQNLPIETKAYEGVGRMFVLTDIQDVKDSLEKRQTAATEKIKQIEQTKELLEKNLKEAEQNLREMVAAKRDSR